MKSLSKITFQRISEYHRYAETILCTIYLERAWELIITEASSTVFQFYSTACKCELISETRKALVALNHCYSLITLNVH